VTAKDSKPTSMPTTESFSGSGSVFTMHEKQAYHFPFSFLSVSVSTSPAIGRCRFTFTLPIFDNDSCVPATLKPACGYVKESYRSLPLKRGKPRPLKNAL